MGEEKELRKEIQYLIAYAEEHFGSSRYRKISIVNYPILFGLFRIGYSIILYIGNGKRYIRSEYTSGEFGYRSIKLLQEAIERELDLR